MKYLLAIILALPLSLVAHAGCTEHDHVYAPHGGVLEHRENVLVELVDTENPMRIYILDRDMKPVSTKNYDITASLHIPRRRGSGSVSLQRQSDHFLADIRTSGRVHRYTLNLDIALPTGDEQVQFQIEP